MKTNIFKIIMLTAGFSLLFNACDTDIDKMYVTPAGQVTAPALSLEGFTDIVADESNVDLSPFVLSWTKSDFGEDVLVEYALEMSASSDFKDSYTSSIGNNIYSTAPSCADLSKWAIEHFNGLDEQKLPVKVSLFARICASAAVENPTVTIPPEIIYSNAISFSVVPHYVPDEYPSQMYMIGAEFGDWDWNSEEVVEMIPVHSFAGNFWCIRYFNAGKGFKWNSERAWDGGDFTGLNSNNGYYIDGDCYVETAGLYMVFIDMVNNQIQIEPAKVYGMGTCFGGWDMGTYPFSTDGKTMKITTAAAGELRMYAASDISPIGGDWWKMEFVPIDGNIEYRGKGDDQERINVGAGKEVVLDFNAGTGIIK